MEPLPPGRCTAKDLERLAEVTAGKVVLMVGAYCGRAACVIGKNCTSLMVIEDFASYSVDWSACVQEFMRVCADYDDKITVLNSINELSTEQLKSYNALYVDADCIDAVGDVLDSIQDQIRPGLTVLWHDGDSGLQQSVCSNPEVTLVAQ